MQISFQAELEDIKARKDHTLAIKVSTNELTSEDTAYIFSMFQKPLFMAIADTGIERLDVPDDLVEFKDEKSPSKRLKSVMFIYFKQKMSGKQGDFNKWYENYLDELRNKFLDKLD
jgi:hypothetical protein